MMRGKLNEAEVIVIGGGLAGIAAASELARSGVSVLLLESDKVLGGKLPTEFVDGYTIDRGFQVHFTSYPELKGINDQLQLRSFRKGALVIKDGVHLIDIARPFKTIFSKAFGMKDKLLTLVLSIHALRGRQLSSDRSIREYLSRVGFSEKFILNFASPFLGGIFFDRGLSGSASQFLNVWRYLCLGRTVLPAKGIRAIPDLLATDIPDSNVRLQTPVTSLEETASGVTISAGESMYSCKVAIVATPVNVATLLTGKNLSVGTKHSVSLYFSSNSLPVDQPYLVLNGHEGTFNHFVPLSLVQPSYAPTGMHLSCVVLVGEHNVAEAVLSHNALAEMKQLFPAFDFSDWKLLRVVRNQDAQLLQEPGFQGKRSSQQVSPRLILAGEYVSTSSINDAVASGRRAAKLAMEGIR